MSEQSYVEGFMAKCAEFGVDPQALLKLSGGDADTANKNLSGRKFRKKLQNQTPKGKTNSDHVAKGMPKGLG